MGSMRLIEILFRACVVAAGGLLHSAQQLLGEHSFEHVFGPADIDLARAQRAIRRLKSRAIGCFVSGDLFRNGWRTGILSSLMLNTT